MAAAKKSEPAVNTNSANSGIGQVEAFCMNALGAIPVPQFKAWVSGYFQPEKTYEAEKGNANFTNILVNAVMIGAIAGIVSFIVNVATSLMGAVISPSGLGSGIVMAVIASVATVIIAPIGILIGSGIYFVLAKIMGGKGGYMQQTLGLTLVAGGMTLITAPLQILAAIPCAGFIFSLVVLAFSLYGVYSEYRIIKTVHQLSGLKAALVIIIPIIVLVVLAIIAVIIMGAAIMGLAGAGALASGLGD